MTLQLNFLLSGLKHLCLLYVSSSVEPLHRQNLCATIIFVSLLLQCRKNIAKTFKKCFRAFFRSSHRRCSIRKGVLEISQNSQENTCARVSFLIKLQASGNFAKKETLAQVFSCEFCEISRTPFLQNTSGRLLLFFGEIENCHEKIVRKKDPVLRDACPII